MNTLKDITILPHFSKQVHLLIVGSGEVKLLKSLSSKTDVSTFYGVTDTAGDEVVFSGTSEDSVMFNAELSNECHRVHYALELVQGTAKYEMIK